MKVKKLEFTTLSFIGYSKAFAQSPVANFTIERDKADSKYKVFIEDYWEGDQFYLDGTETLEESKGLAEEWHQEVMLRLLEMCYER